MTHIASQEIITNFVCMICKNADKEYNFSIPDWEGQNGSIVVCPRCSTKSSVAILSIEEIMRQLMEV